MSTKLDPNLAAAVDAVRLAGVVCKHVQSQPGGVQRIVKPDQSPVTIGDYCSQALVARTLHARLKVGGVGNVPLVSEESSAFLRQPSSSAYLEAALAALRASGTWPEITKDELLNTIDLGAGHVINPGDDHEPFWTLDPIDGTKGFLRNQHYAVCLALIVKGQPVLSAVACPNMSPDPSAGVSIDPGPGCIVAASAATAGVWLIKPDAASFAPGAWTSELVHRELKPDPAGPRLARSVERGHSNRSAMEQIIQHLGDMRVDAEADGQCKYALVALGRADAYIRVPPHRGHREHTWDHAPGTLLVRQAGAKVTDNLDRHIWFGDADMTRTSGVIAAEPATHARIIAAIRELKLA